MAHSSQVNSPRILRRLFCRASVSDAGLRLRNGRCRCHGPFPPRFDRPAQTHSLSVIRLELQGDPPRLPEPRRTSLPYKNGRVGALRRPPIRDKWRLTQTPYKSATRSARSADPTSSLVVAQLMERDRHIGAIFAFSRHGTRSQLRSTSAPQRRLLIPPPRRRKSCSPFQR